MGLSISLGYESSNVLPTSNSELGFSVNQYEGQSAGISVGSGFVGGQLSGSHNYATGAEAFRDVIPGGGFYEGGLSTNVIKGGFKLGLDWSNTTTRLIGR